MKDYLLLLFAVLWSCALALKPGSNIYPNEYCLRDGQYLPHPHSPCRYLRCGHLPSGLDIDDDLRKVLFSAEYRCPIGYAVHTEVFRKSRNGHLTDICTAKDTRCLKESHIPGATQPPLTVEHRRPHKKYGHKFSKPKGHSSTNRKFSSGELSRMNRPQNVIQSNSVRASEAPLKHKTIKFGRDGHRVAGNLVIPRQIAQLHPWLVQNESSVPYVAGPPLPIGPLTTALPLTTEPPTPKYAQRRRKRLHRGHHRNKSPEKQAVYPLPIFPPGYKPKPDTSDIQSDYSVSDNSFERGSTISPLGRSSSYVTQSPFAGRESKQLKHEHSKRPAFKYWLGEKTNKSKKHKKSSRESTEAGGEKQKKSRPNRSDTDPHPSPSYVTPKVTYEHLTHARRKKAEEKHKHQEPSGSPPGVYTKFVPEPLDFGQEQLRKGSSSDELSQEKSPRTEQVDVVDYGTYSNSDRATPWPLPVGLDDAINRYLPDDDLQKSTGMYIPEEALATLKLKVLNEKGDGEEKEEKTTFDDSKEFNQENLDTGKDSPMFPVPVVVRGENKATGNPLSLSNLPRGYYVLMPLKKPDDMPILPKVSLSGTEV